MSKSSKSEFTWETLPDYFRQAYKSKEDWEEAGRRARAREQEERRKPKKPKDWVEPSIGIEEVSNFFEPDLAPYMRSKGMTRITRTEYFEFKYPYGVPLEWDRFYEAEMPDGLRDIYLTIDKRLKRS
jgi:hypothetical protein